jgi:hypothetical protein
MISISSGDKLYSQSEILNNVRADMQQHDITEVDERFITILSIALNEPPDFIRGALEARR